MTRVPTTLHEHFRADPRGADSFGKWIEDWVWELLQRPARAERFTMDDWVLFGSGRAFDMIALGSIGGKRRVVLLDGTIIKEWAAVLEATMDRASTQVDRVVEQEASR